MFASEVSTFGISTALAEQHTQLGNFEDAKKLATEAKLIGEHTGQIDNIYAAYAEGILAEALYREGNYRESADKYRDALRIYERHYQVARGPEDVALTGAMEVLAWTLLSRKDFAAAKQACSTALGMASKLLGGNSIQTATNLANLGVALMNLGELYQPEFYFKKAIRVFAGHRKPPIIEEMNRNIGMIHLNLGNLYYLRGNDKLAAHEYSEMESLLIHNSFPSMEVCAALKNFAAIRWRQGATGSAERLLAIALVSMQANPEFGVDHKQTLRVQEMLESLRRGDPAPTPLRPLTLKMIKKGFGTVENEELLFSNMEENEVSEIEKYVSNY